MATEERPGRAAEYQRDDDYELLGMLRRAKGLPPPISREEHSRRKAFLSPKAHKARMSLRRGAAIIFLLLAVPVAHVVRRLVASDQAGMAAFLACITCSLASCLGYFIVRYWLPAECPLCKGRCWYTKVPGKLPVRVPQAYPLLPRELRIKSYLCEFCIYIDEDNQGLWW
jgi:hypothetical protein